MSTSVLQSLRNGVLTVTLNEPQSMNALSTGITNGLFEALERASSDDDVRAVVLTGAGRGFCAGATVGAGGFPGSGGPASTPPRQARMDRMGGSARTVLAFAHCDKPIIAAVNGPAAGAGFGIATCCDVRFMASSARMGSIFIKRGLASDYGAAYWVPRIVGVARAFEILYDGALMPAQRCLELGLVTRVVADDQLLAEAQAYAQNIANGPPLGYTALRRMLQRSLDMPINAFVEYEWTSQLQLLTSKDVTEGFSAFLQKREPNFKGE